MNKLTRFVKTALASLLVVSLALVVVPSAEAQIEQCSNAAKPSIEMSITPPGDRIKPMTDTAVLKGKVTYTASEQSTSVTPVQITIDARAENPAWAVVSVSPTTAFVDLENNAKTTKTVNVDISVALSRDAPAFAEQNIIMTAKADAGTCAVAVPESSTKALIKADFYEQTQARFGKTIFPASQNDQVSIPLTIENFGNGPISVSFKKGDDTSKALTLALPGVQIVPSTIGGGDSNKLDMTIDVKTPFKNGYENRQDELYIDITGTSAIDPSVKLSQELQVSAIIQTQGVYVPGFEAVTMITALLGAVLASRRLAA